MITSICSQKVKRVKNADLEMWKIIDKVQTKLFFCKPRRGSHYADGSEDQNYQMFGKRSKQENGQMIKFYYGTSF